MGASNVPPSEFGWNYSATRALWVMDGPEAARRFGKQIENGERRIGKLNLKRGKEKAGLLTG